MHSNVSSLSSTLPLSQDNADLQLGLRTGFCGSLTTFASWNHAMILLLLADEGAADRQASIWNGPLWWWWWWWWWVVVVVCWGCGAGRLSHIPHRCRLVCAAPCTAERITPPPLPPTGAAKATLACRWVVRSDKLALCVVVGRWPGGSLVAGLFGYLIGLLLSLSCVPIGEAFATYLHARCATAPFFF